MDRNTFTGLFLILIILIGFTYLTKPSEEEIKRERIVQDSIARSKTSNTTAAAAATASPVKKDTTPTVDSAALGGPFGPANQGNASTVVLQNEHLKVNLSTKGGRIASVELKEYKTYDKKPVILFNEEESNFGLVFNAGNNVISTKNLYFTPSASQLTVSSKDSGAVTMRLNYSPEQYIDYRAVVIR